MSQSKKYGIWEYMSEQHGLTLLESEVHEIIELARQEIELPNKDEINQYIFKVWTESENKADVTFINGVVDGIKWVLCKVRNPYPKTIQFLRDDENGMMGEIKYDLSKPKIFDELTKRDKESTIAYHKMIAESVYEWAKFGLPFFWDLCENLKDGTRWICMPPKDGKEITLFSKFVYIDGKDQIKVSIKDFPKQFKIIPINEQRKSRRNLKKNKDESKT